jgi:hypothetical protein
MWRKNKKKLYIIALYHYIYICIYLKKDLNSGRVRVNGRINLTSVLNQALRHEDV